ncbi:enoyl-CoA hydratase/isomerase family protein [Orrella sp. JC864]|uniref:enoyl-CoA hydratase/isomerase family protein n=1 Tax=Orrella sp. JC864 TaxID=3120298 RepID=UPI003009C3E1
MNSDTQTVEQDLLVQADGPVLRITFNRPQARNAMKLTMYEQLAQTLGALHEQPQIRVVVLRGAGDKAFASGTDISEFKRFSSAQHAIDYEHTISRILGVIENCPVPTIAAIAGACTGGGMGIAACCDLRIAAGNVRFGMPMARTLGNCLSATTHARLAALIGPGRVKDLLLTARLVEADEALRWGLVSEVLADEAALQARADELAATIAGHAPLTMRVTKETLAALAPPVPAELEEQLLLKAYLSQDFAEGVAAFLEKREPRWSGK